MLNYNEIKERKYIIFEDEPYEVLSSWVFRKQQRKPVNQTKLRNLFTGSVVEHSFHAADKVHEADVVRKEATYIFHKPARGNNPAEYWFSWPKNPAERFTIKAELVEDKIAFVKEKSPVLALIFTNRDEEEQIIGIEPPVKVELKVTEAAPAVKGDTATGGTKQVILETGLTMNVPLFINEGDILRINTDTGQYVERAEKN